MHDVVQEWYANFVNVEQETLFELILAANYMDIKPLLDLTCATVASMIKGMYSCENSEKDQIFDTFLLEIPQARPQRRFARHSILSTTSPLRRRHKCERRINGVRRRK